MKIKWKSQTEIDNEKLENGKFKGKKVSELSANERNELLEKIAKDLGYI